MVPMEVLNGVQKVPEPSPESVSLKVLDPSPDNERTIHCFAHTMAEDIMYSATYESSSGCPPVQERLAEKLASLAITAALKEAIRSEIFWSNTRSWSYSNPIPSSDRREQGLHNTRHGEVHMHTEMSGNGEKPQYNPNVTIKSHSSGSSTSTSQPSKHTHSYCSFLPQSGLPTVGSLDYPDAPPTTPLFPEMVQSRASFTQKLKGRLAKEFLPSPPPPTPKEKHREGGLALETVGEVEDNREGEDFMGRLWSSLSLECSEREEVWKEEEEIDLPTGILMDGYEERGPHGRRAKLMAFVDALYVDALSDEITTWMTNNMTNIDNLSLICDQMVDQIITSSMSEVRLRKYVGRLVSDALSLGWEAQKAASLHDSLVLRQEQIGRREPNPMDPEAHLIVYPYPTNPNQSSSIQLCSPKTNEMDLDLTTNTAHPPAHSPTSVISQSYAEDLARAVVRCCVMEASRKQCM
ncbi:uncharacterized protein si:dkey-171c9.3 [Salvelinus namaycush]|uniref:Uncharacterized protein si:dkey-171c9.3 n=1 Tax=Salvelinus namaycush TaxID=8040 RepID=A0A8U0R0U9_SALNM|nr:uncharacterized protein si:dkey-171c9.3 [Salvelinus namaycush]